MENLIFFICFILFSLFTAFSMLLMGYIFSYKSSSKDKSSTYECGLAPKTSAKINFNIHYFMYLIIFLILDVSTVLLYPILATGEEYSDSHVLIIIAFLVVTLITVLIFNKGIKNEHNNHRN